MNYKKIHTLSCDNNILIIGFHTPSAEYKKLANLTPNAEEISSEEEEEEEDSSCPEKSADSTSNAGITSYVQRIKWSIIE